MLSSIWQCCLLVHYVEGDIAMIDSKITTKGQTTLPKAVREALAVEAGDHVRYIIQDGEVRIRAVRPIGRLFGMLKNAGPAVPLEEMEQAIVDGACEA